MARDESIASKLPDEKNQPSTENHDKQYSSRFFIHDFLQATSSILPLLPFFLAISLRG